MAKSESTHVAVIAGGGQGIGKANPDPVVRYAIAPYSLIGLVPPLKKTSDEIRDPSMTTSVMTASAEEILVDYAPDR